jgi:diguanylate cyclase (GGDEF)-like protein
VAGNVATALGAVFERVRLTQQLDELLAISRHLTRTSDPQRLYTEVVESAVRVIPGADAASIMLRVGDGYRFAAAVGHDLAMLRSMAPLSEADQLAWHGLGEAAYRAGTPRVLSGNQIVAASSALTGDEGQRRAFEVGGRVHALRANLAVPIADSHEVLGVLNVDSLSHPDAFGPSSLRLAEAFAQQAGAIIRQVQYREALERSAVTDPVTKLGNREGFNQRLHVELSRARRHSHHVSLVMIDLDGFKAVNDRLGHPMGDRALLLVADAMRRERRPFDGLFRWGGDEFAVLLPEVGPEGAHAGARRYVDAIHEVEVGGLRMSASFGTASFPVDGEDADALLRRADDLMYRAKHATDRALHGTS